MTSGKVDDAYWRHLVKCSYDGTKDPFAARLNRLSRLNVAFLFNELTKIKAEVRATETTSQEQMELLAVRMHQYGEYHNELLQGQKLMSGSRCS